jgi:hypothetical protein
MAKIMFRIEIHYKYTSTVRRMRNDETNFRKNIAHAVADQYRFECNINGRQQ